jgi:hypothetical protein
MRLASRAKSCILAVRLLCIACGSGKVDDKMNMRLRTSTEPGTLHAKMSGPFSLDEAKRIFLEILEAIVQHKMDKVLIDGRAIEGEPTTMQRFIYGEFAAAATKTLRERLALPKPPRFACVLQEPVLDPMRFGETVAVNRGMHVKVFDNLEDAFCWLEVEQTRIGGAD